MSLDATAGFTFGGEDATLNVDREGEHYTLDLIRGDQTGIECRVPADQLRLALDALDERDSALG